MPHSDAASERTLDDLNALGLGRLFPRLVPRDHLHTLLQLARHEEFGERGDITTTSLIDADAQGTASIVTRASGVIAGLAAVVPLLEVFAAVDERPVSFEPREADGVFVEAGTVLGVLHGRMRSILAAERTLLNLLSRLSGIATLTNRYVDQAAPAGAVICDTRKTTPGLRGLEKYAVRCGGGTLHRIGLHDAALFKDNHLAGLGDDELAARLATAIARVRAEGPVRFVEVEVDHLGQLDAILTMAPGLVDIVLLDNMSLDDMREAVRRRDEHGTRPQLEASGGVALERVGDIAGCGVDRISVGGLTHSVTALDIGLDITADDVKRTR